MRSNLTTLELHLHHETKPGQPDEGAILVSDDGDKSKAVWLPKSAIEFERVKGAIHKVTLPIPLAQEKGLI